MPVSSYPPQGIITTGDTINYYDTGERTGTGAEETIAHGLKRAPKLVMPIFTGALALLADIVQGTHDSVNLKITVTLNVKYRIIAL